MRRYLMLFCVLAGCAQAQSPEAGVWAIPEVPAASVPVWITDDIHDIITPDTTPDLFDERDTDDAIAEIQLSDFCLVDYWAEWCGPCKQWADREESRVRCRVDKWDAGETPLPWLTSLPTFRLLRYDRTAGKWLDLKVFVGYTSAEDINAEVERQTKAAEPEADTAGLSQSAMSVRRSAGDLRSWIEAHYTPETELVRATVEPIGFAWEHLRDDHGFSAAQINQLPRWMVLALHDAAHPQLGKGGVILSAPLIGPYQ